MFGLHLETNLMPCRQCQDSQRSGGPCKDCVACKGTPSPLTLMDPPRLSAYLPSSIFCTTADLTLLPQPAGKTFKGACTNCHYSGRGGKCSFVLDRRLGESRLSYMHKETPV